MYGGAQIYRINRSGMANLWGEISTNQSEEVNQDEINREYIFLSNNTTISAKEIALIYKKHWGIELLFKKMKQNFQLHYFHGQSENAIRTQVWRTLIAQLLLSVLHQKANMKKAFSTVATMVKIYLISMLDVNELLQNTKRTWARIKNGSGTILPDLVAT